jgi:hypothetical protein
MSHSCFIAYKTVGPDLEKIMKELHSEGYTHRLRTHIQSLVMQNRSVLALPGVDKEGFCNVVADYYNTQVSNSRDGTGKSKEELGCGETLLRANIRSHPNQNYSSSDDDVPAGHQPIQVHISRNSR